MDSNYKYEIAFSFLQVDENLAFELNDLITDRISTFIYSKRQEELGGTDGEVSFNKVFSEDSRFVVVLYRDGWGLTPWTRIEETAIRNRAFNDGWEFVIFILLDKKSSPPQWLPKAQLWIDFERWGLKGAAPIIEQRLKDIGGTIRPEGIDERAERLKRQRLQEIERKKYLESDVALTDANDEFVKIVTRLKTVRESLEDKQTYLHFGFEENPGFLFSFGYKDFYIAFRWTNPHFSHSLEETELEVFLYKREGHYKLNYKETVLKLEKYKFDRTLSGTIGWLNKEFITSDNLIDKWVKMYLDGLAKMKI
jgi:hypothetical protein